MPAQRSRSTQGISVEVAADTTLLPKLAVVAPTPRTFTFPISHNLDISPYSTPSNSPFEPDLNFLDIASPTSSYLSTPQSLTRTPSPDSSISIPSPSSDRQSDSISAERRPKKGEGSYIKRPENAFILFRRKCCEDRLQGEEENGPPKKQRQADLSKAISQKWKGLSAKEREYWEDLAKEKKREHQEMYPDYVYRPQRVRDKDGKIRNKTYTRRVRGNAQQDADAGGNRAYVVPLPRQTSSTSAVAYHTVHIPIILPRQWCPPSPSHLPPIGGLGGQTVSDDVNYFPHTLSNTLTPEGRLASTMRTRLSLPIPTLGSNGGQLPPLSPLSSSDEASPISEPMTPNSVLLRHPSFAQLSVFDQKIPSSLDVQIASSSDMSCTQLGYPWETNPFWQTESSMLMSGDFDVNAIPPTEFGQSVSLSEYAEDAPASTFGISPIATLCSFPMEDFSQGFGDDFLSVDTFSPSEPFPRFEDCISIS